MKALSVERSILEGEKEVKELFEFVTMNAEHFTAYTMEQEVFSKVMQIGLAAMKCYFAEKGTGDVGDELVVEDDRVLHKEQTLRGRDYFSVFGKFKVPRTYYRGGAGVPGIMPLDAQADLPERCYSYLLQEWMDFLSLRDTFKESEITLAKLLGVRVGASRFEVISQETATKSCYETFYAHTPLPSSTSEGELQVLGFDGKGVPVIKTEAAKLKARPGKGEKRQKKKEAMVGVSYTVDRHERTPEEVAENLIYPERVQAKREAERQTAMKPPTDRPPGAESEIVASQRAPITQAEQTTQAEPMRSEAPNAQNIRRLASLRQSKAEVVNELVKDAARRDPTKSRPWVVVMDGALGLWTLVATILPGTAYIGILDIIHVAEYLWKAGTALYGEQTPETQHWVYRHLLSILRGRVGRVIGGLKQTVSKRRLNAGQKKALQDATRYFENHRSWMRYDEYLKAGYPIGSGVVESTCGHTVKDRMEGTGRRWSLDGAESTLLLRSVYTSGDWDAYWDSYIDQERTRLYERTLQAIHLAEEYDDDSSSSKVIGM